MKKYMCTLTLLFIVAIGFGQSEKTLGILESDTTWLKEIITFPIDFAPNIKYTGYEDLRFAKKWRDKTSDEFWCYMFAWYITNSNERQTVEMLETNIKAYYDGLMTAVNKKKDFKVPKTVVLFIKNESDSINADFIGEIYVYDSFNTENMMTLNVSVNVNYCQTKKQSTIVFKLSPQDFESDVWNKFEEIKLKDNICDNP